MNTKPILYDKRYKATSYVLFMLLLALATACTVLLIGAVDYVIKGEEPLHTLLIKSDKQIRIENDQLHEQVQALENQLGEVHSLRAALKAKAENVGVTGNLTIPVIGHYSNNTLQERNYNAFMIEKYKFYRAKSDSLERWIQINF